MMQRMLPVPALGALTLALVAALPFTAQANTAWSGTRTMAADVDATKAGAELQAGTAIHVSVSLSMRNKAELDALTAAIMAGHTDHHLTSAEVMERHAPTIAQAQAVADYLRAAGFVNVQVAGNRMLVSADGTAGTVKSAFHTELRHFDVDGRDAFANVQPAFVPPHLAGIVSGVSGLDTVNRLHMHLVRAPHAAATSATGAASPVGHAPSDFPVIYDANGLPPATNTTIGIISGGDISQTLTDLAAFVAQNGLQSPVVEQVAAGPQSGDTSGVIEWDLDSQTSLSAAGGQVKKMIFYVGKDVLSLTSLVEAFNTAATDNQAQVVNASLGTCETTEQQNGDEASIDASLEMGVAQGQTWTISSGDSGAYECNKSKTGTSYPAVSPYAMAIGGTTLSTTGTTTYASETAWSCKSYLLCQQFIGGGGGGGTSTTEAAPVWQTKALGTLTGRSIPDISFSADPNSGAIVVINGGSSSEQVGGTSLAAPMFAGFWARIQSKNGNKLSTPNTLLYKYSVGTLGPKFLHDVTSGSMGYTAGPGWDLATGFGSLDIGAVESLIEKSHAK